MLTYSFSNIGSDSLYEHLYKCIKQDIMQGVLSPGDKLPSKRNFARNLNISTITIESAYAQLVAEGYIYSVPKKGYFISDITQPFKSEHKVEEESFVAVEKKQEYFVDFTSNQTNSENFPFSIWAKLMRETMAENSDALMVNPPSGGIMELRVAIAKHLKEFRGMNVSPDQIIVGAGTEYLYGLLIQLLGFDKTYAVEDPGYKKISQVYDSNQVSCCFLPMDKEGLKIAALENSKAEIVHISPSHHFPTGIVTPISRRYELLGWASKSKSRYIIEDDYDSEFRLMGKPIPSLQSIDVMEKVIYINTFTKSLASTIRISYMVLPKHLVERFYHRLYFYSCTVSNFEQYTLAEFIKEGYFEKHINRMRNFYRNQRDILLSHIKNSTLASYIHITEEDAGLHFLMHIHSIRSEESIKQRAKQEGLSISFLSHYYKECSPETEHALVINYSGIDQTHMKEAIVRLSRCIC